MSAGDAQPWSERVSMTLRWLISHCAASSSTAEHSFLPAPRLSWSTAHCRHVPRAMHGPAGFASSNISKGFLLICGIWSITAIATKKQGLFNLDLDLVGRGQIWRLLTHSFVWSTTSELVIGSICLYNWRLFERQFGTRKFGGCLFFLIVASMILQVVVQLVSRGAVPLLSGPYAVVFGLLANFMFDIPQSAPFTLFGIPLSDKLFVYRQ
jgi:membrane associated rhomboid family serine protease